ncbi:MAG: hypothetical protein EOP86_22650 [Verrucomicrobiaceae bacterium]|nr:MAG: hypothetical protein EOP86_22650 [Verrucomicrobiaceae bacterium]
MEKKTTPPPDLNDLIEEIHDQLAGSMMLKQMTLCRDIPELEIDIWATLYAWCGEACPTAAITVDEAARLSELSCFPYLSPRTHQVFSETSAYILPDSGHWILVARHAAARTEFPVTEDGTVVYECPMLTFVFNFGDCVGTAAYSLAEVATLEDLDWQAGCSMAVARQFDSQEMARTRRKILLAIRKFYLE